MDSARDNAGVIAPPPLIFAAFLAAGLAVDFYVVRLSTGAPATLRHVVAGLIALAALALGFDALFGFRRAGTNANPWRPTTAIVASGAYRITRNPMYVGMALLYLAVAVACDSLVTVLLLIPLLLVIQTGVIIREERYLEAKFGDDYRRYKARVRRWI